MDRRTVVGLFLGLFPSAVAAHNRHRGERRKAREQKQRQKARRRRLIRRAREQQARVDLCNSQYAKTGLGHCDPFTEFCFPESAKLCCELARREFSWWENDSAVHECLRDVFAD